MVDIKQYVYLDLNVTSTKCIYSCPYPTTDHLRQDRGGWRQDVESIIWPNHYTSYVARLGIRTHDQAAGCPWLSLTVVVWSIRSKMCNL